MGRFFYIGLHEFCTNRHILRVMDHLKRENNTRNNEKK